MNILLATIILYLFSCLFVFIDDRIDDLYYFIKGKIIKNKETTREWSPFQKNSWLRDKYLYIYRFFLHIQEFPFDFYLETKWFIQRGIRGYSDRDCWGIDYYLADIMPKMIRELKKNKHGIPSSMFSKNARLNKYNDYTKQEYKRAEKRWENTLNTIIKTFETAKKIQNSNLIYYSTNVYKSNTQLIKKLKENNFKVMTFKECKEFEKGLDLFKDNFFLLWD